MSTTKTALQAENETLRSYLRGVLVAVKDVPPGDQAAAWRTLGRVEFLCSRALGLQEKSLPAGAVPPGREAAT